jgi:Flp pilus assembly protein TadB
MNFKNPLKLISPSLFALILICFFLPFTTISCQSTPIVTMNGYQLATGTTVDQTSGIGNSLSTTLGSLNSSASKSSDKKIPGNPLAGFILAITCAGIALGFVTVRHQEIIQAIVAGIGAILLFILKSEVDSQTLKQGQGVLQTSYGSGYWLSLLLFLGAVGFNGYRTWLDKKARD